MGKKNTFDRRSKIEHHIIILHNIKYLKERRKERQEPKKTLREEDRNKLGARR